jgi:multidrug efflux system outer membrane protein
MSFVLGGCGLFSVPKKVIVKIPEKFKYSVKSSSKNQSYLINNNWWKNFDDTRLDVLVGDAEKNNLNYMIAIKNIKVARTYVSQSESSLFPTVNFSFSSTRNKMAGYESSIFSGGASSGSQSAVIYNLNQAGLSASYELDVWNQLNNAVKQAKANVAVSKEDADVIKLTLISNVVQAYFQINTLDSAIKNLKNQYAAQKEIFTLYTVQYKDGLINAQQVENAKTSIEIIKTELNDSIELKDTTQNTLAYYLGEFPERFNFSQAGKNINSTHKINKLNELKTSSYSKLIPPNIPSLILTQRPDVKEAEYNVLSYAYAEKESLANFFPTFSLTGNYGYASTGLNNFVNNTDSVWNFGLNLLAPIFNYKENVSIYKRSILQYQQAVLNYRNTIINAFSETDSALISYKKNLNTLSSYRKNYAYSLKLYNIYRVQYKTGITGKITYLTYKLDMLAAEYNLINQNLLVKEDIINIYNALGMGLK